MNFDGDDILIVFSSVIEGFALVRTFVVLIGIGDVKDLVDDLLHHSRHLHRVGTQFTRPNSRTLLLFVTNYKNKIYNNQFKSQRNYVDFVGMGDLPFKLRRHSLIIRCGAVEIEIIS